MGRSEVGKRKDQWEEGKRKKEAEMAMNSKG